MSHQINEILEFIESIKLIVLLILVIIPSFLLSIIKFFIPRTRKNISGQLVLITGGSEGIGRALAFRLAQEGCNIAIANRNLEKGQKTAEEIRKKFNVKVQAFQCDVSRREDVKRLKNEVKKLLGTVDLLVNNAGLMPVECSLLEGDDDEYYQYVMDVNLTSYIWITRAFLPDMIKQKRGHIIGVSSQAYQLPTHSMTIYATTKFGNKGFIDALREDLCCYGFEDFIKASTVFTGFVKTKDDMVDAVTSNFRNFFLSMCEPEKVAETVINGILRDEENIYASITEALFASLVYIFPRNMKNMFFQNSFKRDKRDEYVQMRLKNCKLLN